jgi:hypothetical protein
MKHRTVDTTSPAYRRGERAANVLLDLGAGAWAADVLMMADMSASTAIALGQGDRYAMARGLGDTLRDFLADQADGGH